MQAVGSVGFALAVAAALAAGPPALGVVVVAAAFVVLLDLTLLLGRAAAKPVLPVAAVPGLVLPVLAAIGAGGDEGAWGLVGDVFAFTVIGGFALVLVSGRRRGAVIGLGATFAAGLLVGLGAASVLLLAALPDGVRWVLAVAVLAAVADAAMPVAVGLNARWRDGERRATGIVPVVATIALLGAAAGALSFVLAPPLTLGAAAVFAAAVAVAALGGDHLRRVLATEAGMAERPPVLGGGVVLGAVDAVLFAAPVAYVIARAAVV